MNSHDRVNGTHINTHKHTHTMKSFFESNFVLLLNSGSMTDVDVSPEEISFVHYYGEFALSNIDFKQEIFNDSAKLRDFLRTCLCRVYSCIINHIHVNTITQNSEDNKLVCTYVLHELNPDEITFVKNLFWTYEMGQKIEILSCH